MWRLLISLLLVEYSYSSENSIISSASKAIEEGKFQLLLEPKDSPIIYTHYDFVIVGAGTAGCVLADRLTENPNWSVLLIEAGGPEKFIMDYPLLVNYLQFTDANWKYKTEPSNSYCLAMDNNQCNWPRGKVMGGSSVLNYMIHTRGNRRDYDNWEAMGNQGWGYKDVLKYFKMMEKFEVPKYKKDKKYHSSKGKVNINYAPYRSKIAEAIMDSAEMLNYPTVDYNAKSQIGFSYIQLNFKNGTRYSSNRAYLHAISQRRNLNVKKFSEVTKILIDPMTKKAFGVEFVNNMQTFKVFALKEVIISAGAINSPKLLMLSGIGPARDLSALGIPVASNLMVGYNLMDHITLGGLMFLIDQPISLQTNRILENKSALIEYMSYHRGPISIPGGNEVIAFFDLKYPQNPDGWPDLEILFQSGSLTSDPLLRKNFGIRDDIFETMFSEIENKDSFMVWPMLLLPKSKGRILLRDTNPLSYPVIIPNYLSHPDDINTIIDGVFKTLELVQMSPLQDLGARLFTVPVPPCAPLGFGTREYWECHLRYFTFNIYHYSGTAKMGPKWDETAVVDPRLRVYGIENLRVIDASIMPMIPAGHTNTPVYMIAEKGSAMIKEDWTQ